MLNVFYHLSGRRCQLLGDDDSVNLFLYPSSLIVIVDSILALTWVVFAFHKYLPDLKVCDDSLSSSLTCEPTGGLSHTGRGRCKHRWVLYSTVDHRTLYTCTHIDRDRERVKRNHCPIVISICLSEMSGTTFAYNLFAISPSCNTRFGPIHISRNVVTHYHGSNVVQIFI